jgi:nucleotide-binding universal stress UspA family protein
MSADDEVETCARRTTMRQSVLVPLDFGREADRALPIAESLARRLGTRLDVVSLTSPGIDPLQDMAEARAHASAMGVELSKIRIGHDDVVSGVLSVAAEQDAVLCCATHARGRLGEWLFQSVSADIIRRSTRPVLLVGPEVEIDPRPTFTEILACIHGSPLTPRVASTAAMWSRLLDAKVRLLDVVDQRADMAAAWEPTKRLATTLTRLGAETMPEVLVADDAAGAILHTAGYLSGPLVIIGAHDHADVDRPALGRVSLEVVRHSPFPVLVVPSRAVPPVVPPR